jgi:hypothetical protein
LGGTPLGVSWPEGETMRLNKFKCGRGTKNTTKIAAATAITHTR